MAKPPLDPKLEKRLKCYLHTGMEVPKYFPGNWESHKYYEIDKLQAINEAMEQNNNDVEVVNIILKAKADGYCTRFDTIVFALIKCLLLGGPLVKEAAYKAVAKICEAPEQILHFAKYTRFYKTGNGQGWCKLVRSWYATKDPMELAMAVTRVKARYTITHKMLIRKCHLKVEETDVARDAVIKYVIYGLKQAKQKMANKEEAKDILDYIQKVDSLRHCEDSRAAAVLIEVNKFTLEHVPGHLLTSQEVWDAALLQMPLAQILDNLQRLHNMGFLHMDSTTTAILLSLFHCKDFIMKSMITPLTVYITICNYSKKNKPMMHEKAKIAQEKELRRRTRQIYDAATGRWNWSIPLRHPKEVKVWGIEQSPNRAIINALENVMFESWCITPPTGASYMITMDMRDHMFKGRHFCKKYGAPKKAKKEAAPTVPVTPAPSGATGTVGASGDTAETTTKTGNKRLFAECFYNRYVKPGHAAIILALQLLKREKNVKLAVFTEEGVQIVSVERNIKRFEDAEFVLRTSNVGRVQLDAPIVWAMTKKQNVDVFINMIDRPTRYMELDIADRGGRGPAGKYGPPPVRGKDARPDRCPVRALQRYREQNNIPNAKLIVMSLASHRVGTTDGTHDGVLDIIGIDDHVLKVMDAFVKGQFN